MVSKNTPAPKSEKPHNTPEFRKRRTIETNFYSIEEGETLEGTLISRDSVSFPNGVVGRYLIRKESGEEVTILGSTQLDTLLGQVEDGDFVWITLAGTVKTNQGRKMKNWKVDVEE